MHLYIVSGILLIVPFVDIALAAPVLVQEKRQACADMAGIPEFSVTVLEKRVGMGRIDAWAPDLEGMFSKQMESSAADEPSTPGPLELSDMSKSAVNAPVPNPGPSTEYDHSLDGMEAPLSSPVYPTYFHPDNKFLGTYESRPNTGPPNPSTEFDSDPRLVVEEPPSPIKGSPTEPGFEMVDMRPSDPVSSTKGADTPSENLQTDSGALKG
jgi:hypothetical protein